MIDVQIKIDVCDLNLKDKKSYKTIKMVIMIDVQIIMDVCDYNLIRYSKEF